MRLADPRFLCYLHALISSDDPEFPGLYRVDAYNAATDTYSCSRVFLCCSVFFCLPVPFFGLFIVAPDIPVQSVTIRSFHPRITAYDHWREMVHVLTLVSTFSAWFFLTLFITSVYKCDLLLDAISASPAPVVVIAGAAILPVNALILRVLLWLHLLAFALWLMQSWDTLGAPLAFFIQSPTVAAACINPLTNQCGCMKCRVLFVSCWLN